MRRGFDFYSRSCFLFCWTGPPSTVQVLITIIILVSGPFSGTSQADRGHSVRPEPGHPHDLQHQAQKHRKILEYWQVEIVQLEENKCGKKLSKLNTWMKFGSIFLLLWTVFIHFLSSVSWGRACRGSFTCCTLTSAPGHLVPSHTSNQTLEHSRWFVSL